MVALIYFINSVSLIYRMVFGFPIFCTMQQEWSYVASKNKYRGNTVFN